MGSWHEQGAVADREHTYREAGHACHTCHSSHEEVEGHSDWEDNLAEAKDLQVGSSLVESQSGLVVAEGLLRDNLLHLWEEVREQEEDSHDSLWEEWEDVYSREEAVDSRIHIVGLEGGNEEDSHRDKGGNREAGVGDSPCRVVESGR